MTPLLAGRALKLSAPDDLPLVCIDSAQIGRVLTNLIENAIKFSESGAPIHVNLRSDSAAVLLCVWNEGAPIPSEEQQRIFDKFHRIQHDARGGTGLGLAICKGIVEAHGERIWTGNEDGGVAFCVALPAVPTDAKAAAARQEVLS